MDKPATITYKDLKNMFKDVYKHNACPECGLQMKLCELYFDEAAPPRWGRVCYNCNRAIVNDPLPDGFVNGLLEACKKEDTKK